MAAKYLLSKGDGWRKVVKVPVNPAQCGWIASISDTILCSYSVHEETRVARRAVLIVHTVAGVGVGMGSTVPGLTALH